ncbi:MAG: hypothetical protein KUG60_01065 [Gammaproteobacteria bacterium]|nr:hypothetical protein [Gammaproteobacteria bacterium]
MGKQTEQDQSDTEHLLQGIKQATENTEKNSQAVVALYALASRRELSLEEKLLPGLTIGAEWFSMPTGLIIKPFYSMILPGQISELQARGNV